MSTPLRAVIVEDSPDDAELLARVLKRSGYDVTYERVHDAESLDEALTRGPWDVVFSDHSMPEFGSGAALQMVRGRDPDVPFLIVSGTMGEDVAVDAMRAGANDYFVKGKLARLPAVVDRELRQASARRTRRSLDRTFHALREVSSAVGRLPEARAVAALAAKHVRELLQVEAAVVHAWDPEAGLLRLIAADGFPEVTDFVVRSGEGVAGLAFEQAALVAAEDESTVGRPERPREDVQSAIAAPLLVGARKIGVVAALSLVRRRFTDEDRQLLQLLASDIAPSIETGRLFAESERQRAEAEALAEAAKVVAAGAVAHDTLRSILTALHGVVPTSGAALLVPTEGGARCEVRAQVGAFAPLGRRSFPSASTIVGRALRMGAIQIRAEGDPPEELQVLSGAAIDLALPILREREPVAVLGLSAGPRGRFSPHEVGVLQRFASLAAMALENARLQAESEGRAVELERLAHFDALTGLPNRALLRDRLRSAFAGPAARWALLHVDVDHFKDVNDAFGLHVGDAVLQALGSRLHETLGAEACVSRVGGDEFAALLQVATDAAAASAARSLHEALDRPIAVGDEHISVRASVGVAVRDGEDAEVLLSRAEAAVEIAKRGDGVCVYSPAQDEYSAERLALMAQLRRAIERDELVLHYQPIVDMPSRRIRGFEALVRWQHPERGLLPPSDVIPLAERAGLMKRLTTWVIAEALRQARRWHDDGLELSVAVNLAMRTLHDVELPDLVRDLLERTGASSEWLVFEITENDVMADAAGATRILRRLREMGVRVSIDDFGTGYSSLAYLQQLEVNTVKIDRSFVMNMAAESSLTIVRATVDLAHALGLEVVAEGVEDQEAWRTLEGLGCDFAQGYHIARPLRAADVTRWSDDWRRTASA